MTFRARAAAGVFITALLAFSAASADDEDALASGEILVHSESVPGSDLPKVVVRGVIDAPPAKVWTIVSDCDVFEERLPRIRSARVLEQTDRGPICEVIVALPFPLSDLRAKTRAVHIEGPPRWSRTWTLIEGDYEVNDGSWVLESFRGDPNRTLATYSVHAVPHSAVPAWARRRAQESSMPDIIERLRRETR
ncbi:MAG: SRPBCC family protein [Myxococcota bacterium]